MKRQLRFFAFAGVVSSGALAAIVAACGGDDTIVTNTGLDSGTDAGTPTPPEDTGAPFDAGIPDALPDHFEIPDFVSLIESTMCSALTKCCFGNANMPDGGIIDGGPFSGKAYSGLRCLDAVKDLGFEFSAVGSDLVDGGTVLVSAPAANDCIAKLNALTCNLTGSELQAIRASCFAAFDGQRDAGAPCVASIQCPLGAFCDMGPGGGGPDSGPGTCTPLRADGGSCGVFHDVNGLNDNVTDSIKDEEACSTRGSGDTHLRCQSYDFGINDYPDAASWICQPTIANGEPCNSTVWCASGICDPNDFICKSPLDYFAANCSSVVVDAGP
jgi:hypothetical protein